MCKATERMVQGRLLSWLHTNQNIRINPSQAGGLSQRDCEEHLAALTLRLQKGLELGLHSVVVYIDFAGAFDKVPRKQLLKRLADAGLPKSILAWLAAFLKDRSFQVKLEGHLSESLSSEAGVPQGSVLGPFLYLVYLSSLLDELDEQANALPAAIEKYAFVDDLTVVVTAATRNAAVESARHLLSHVDTWATKHFAAVSSDKTVLQYFGGDPRNTLPLSCLSLASSRREVKVEYTREQVEQWVIDADNAVVGIRADAREPAAPSKQKAPLSALAGTHLLSVGGTPVASLEDLRRTWPVTGPCTCEVQTAIQWSDTVKLLGLRIDHTLRFEEHCDHVIAQHRSRTALLARLAGIDWGCTAPLLRKVYFAFANSCLLWGLSAWGPLLTNAQVKRLEAEQYTAAKIISNMPASCSKPAAFLQSRITPFPSMVQAAALNTADRMYRMTTTPLGRCAETALFATVHPTASGLPRAPKPRSNWRSLAWDALSKEGLLTQPSPGDPSPRLVAHLTVSPLVPPPSQPWKKTTKVSIVPAFPGLTKKAQPEALAEAAQARIEALEATNDVAIYTDGSARTDEGATCTAGAFYASKAGGLPLPEKEWCRGGWRATSYQTEAAAMRLALISLFHAAEAAPRVRPTSLVIFTDSQSLLRRLKRGELRQSSWQCVGIWELLAALADRGWNITLQYVPGHSGLYGNEVADDVAGQAVDTIKSGHPNVPTQVPLHRGALQAFSRSQSKTALKKKAEQTRWRQHTGGTRLRTENLTRAGERLIMGLACGQHPLVIGGWGPEAPPKMAGSSHPECPHCKKHDGVAIERDTAHILLFCPATGEVPETTRPDELTDDHTTLCREILTQPRTLINRLALIGDIPYDLSHYVRQPAPD
eukprot:TRINITY_DN531_c0_g1_i5.p1 TRINITY_DN531_c0_g1~~TRINITY_DN531_c0_g1_i5.p1  ORF type:complete len:878 (+),score=-7.35 TRINITY_DN531_c0_g1_i5:207-2840(+)